MLQCFFLTEPPLKTKHGFLQIACYFHSKYRSKLSRTYTQIGNFGLAYSDPQNHFPLNWFRSKLVLGKYAGIPCKIPYGHGHISGFFSQDHVRVGDTTIKHQVSVLNFLYGVNPHSGPS